MTSSTDKWKSDTLDEVFRALATSELLSQQLIYKGARVLRLRLQEEIRASMDIDASVRFSTNTSRGVADLEQLRQEAQAAITFYFESQDPVRYVLKSTTIERRRRSSPHPRGWDVHLLKLTVHDPLAGIAFTGEPNLVVDISDPEKMSPLSTSPLDIDGKTVIALTLERIAGEKLRAFLSCLPAYRRKITEKTPSRRVKDIYDLARIVRKNPLDDVAFWEVAGSEFELACESRFIDCSGVESFTEDWSLTAQLYASDPTIPRDVPLVEAEQGLREIVGLFETLGHLPVSYELPPLPDA